MIEQSFHCVRQGRPQENGAAALANVAQHLHSPNGLKEMRLLGNADKIPELSLLLSTARSYGFRAMAMEGPYEELPSVTLPAIVVFKENAREHFAVLHQVDENKAFIADPTSGLVTFSREQFCAHWTGEVVVLTRDPEAEQQVLHELKELRRAGPRLVFGLSVGVVALATLVAASGQLPWRASQSPKPSWLALAALAVGMSSSLWSALLARNCVSCDRASGLVGGLPLAWLGTGLYAMLWAGTLNAPGHFAILAGIFAALGTHAFLFRLLFKQRVFCLPCLVVGLSAMVAMAASLMATKSSNAQHACLVGAAGMSFGLTWAAVRIACQVTNRRLTCGAHKLAQSVIQEGIEVPKGKAHIVVYKRWGCNPCALFESVVRPGLVETFGDALVFEERNAEKHYVRTPLLVMIGIFPLAIIGLQTESFFETIQSAVVAVLEGNTQIIKNTESITLLGYPILEFA